MPNPVQTAPAIDPALLAAPVQPSHVSPMDPLQAAVDALIATGGMPQPGPYVQGGPTDLIEPEWTPASRGVAVQSTPDYVPMANQIPDAWQAAVPGGIQTRPGKVTATVESVGIAPPQPRQPRPSPLGQAMQDEQAALQDAGMAQRVAFGAEAASQNAQAERLATADEQYAADVQLANQQYQHARKVAETNADAETATWMEQYAALAQQEPNPGRWWDNQSGLGKALWGLSMVFSAAHVALTPGAQNVALNMVMDNINRDVAEQKARLDRELGALKLKGEQMNMRQRRNLTDATDDHTMALGRLEVLHQAFRQRAMAPGNEGMAAAMAQADAWFQGQKFELAKGYRTQAFQAQENQLQRGHAYSLAKMADKREREIAAANIAKAYDLARMEAEAASRAAQGNAMKDVEGLSPGLTGARMVGSTLGTDAPQVRKENRVKLGEVFNVANRRFDNLNTISKALDDGSFAQRMTFGDPILTAAVNELAYSTAKEIDPSGKLSDSDVAIAKKITTGFGPDAGFFERSKFEANLADIKKMVKEEMTSMPDIVSNNVGMYLDTNLVGKDAKIVWTPLALQREIPVDPNFHEAMGSQQPSSPTDAADFERKRAMEGSDPMYRGTQLPAYNEGAVQQFTKATAGLGPDAIRELAAKTLRDTADPWSGNKNLGDTNTTRIAIEVERDKAVKLAEKAVRELNITARDNAIGRAFWGQPAPTREDILQMAKTNDLTLTDGATKEIEAALKIAEEAYKSVPHWKKK